LKSETDYGLPGDIVEPKFFYMKMLFWICLVVLSIVSRSQTPETYTIKPDAHVLDVIPVKEIYHYSDFVPGTVVFRHGAATAGRLNYNSLEAAVQFIDLKGDTLSLANEHTILYILIAKDTFYYNDGYIRLLTGSSSVKLGEQVFFKEFIQKPGAYGLSSATTATNNLTALLAKRSVDLNVNQEIVLVKNTSYLIGNKFNEFVPFDRKSIMKMFPRKKPDIDEYLKKNKVNYSKKEDLIKLVDFLKGM
jgi:hypothetical protein